MRASYISLATRLVRLRQVMLRPESVAKSEIWLRAASASFWTENMQEWIAEQSPKVRHAAC